MATKKTETKIEAIKHKDKRTNIPTEELRDFVADDELTPKTMLYPRDPSLDPQLVWRGKDEQDSQDLSVPVVPIYIQDKVHPQAIVEAIKAEAKKGEPEELSLFSDFNGGPHEFNERVEFYQHEQNWSNRLILGDSLLVMTSLTEKEGLKGKVQTIYIDPPYGIKFGSNWQVSTRKRDVKDGKAEDATRQPEQIRAFRDTWKLGIHSYLAYLRDRLVASRELLTETGSVFVQIGDENAHLVRSLMDEVFGSENFCALVPFKKTSGQASNLIAGVCDYIIWYAKDRTQTKFRQPYALLGSGVSDESYNSIELADGTWRRLTRQELSGEVEPPKGRRFRTANLTSQGATAEGSAPFEFEGKTYKPSQGTHWKPRRDGLHNLAVGKRLVAVGRTLAYKRFIDDFPVVALTNLWSDTIESTFAIQRYYVVQTATKVIQRCILMTTDPGDLVLDPTCGSGTTAYVAEQWGRRWITIDTSRVALALARTRLMAAKYPFYLLADSPEGIKKEAELSGKVPPQYQTQNDVRKGFVYKRVPHVTLKSIANNPDIKEGMSRAEIDAAIARHSDTETLFDQPYEDAKRLRVCGPFSVESLSPHRVLSTADEDQDGTVSEEEAKKQQDFGSMILENLKKAGVQNTRKGERLVFDRLEPFAGAYLNGSGEYTDADGKTKRVAVAIGPEHGTVGPMLVKEAAKEAVQGIGFDMLVICGFAFDPHVDEEVKRYGKLTVLPAKMNPDLSMGDELLKKTGAGNLFMVFGEPDVEITKQDGKIVVEIKGIDVYDPTTGQIRSGKATNEAGKVVEDSRDDVACWFIDTDYNGESFFVRHAYFTGADEPYNKLKRALKAEVDEAAWASLYSTVSRPFDKPESGKIAVKVINHYGDEVLRVFNV